jgi:hypothetical protein
MNKLQEKAKELLTIADSFGIDYQIENREGHNSGIIYAVIIDYKTTQGKFYTEISYTETEKARAESWEKIGNKWERVSLKSLPDYFRYHAEENRKQPKRVCA